MYQAVLTKNGVQLHLGTTVKDVISDAQCSVALNNGENLKGDMVTSNNSHRA